MYLSTAWPEADEGVELLIGQSRVERLSYPVKLRILRRLRRPKVRVRG